MHSINTSLQSELMGGGTLMDYGKAIAAIGAKRTKQQPGAEKMPTQSKDAMAREKHPERQEKTPAPASSKFEKQLSWR